MKNNQKELTHEDKNVKVRIEKVCTDYNARLRNGHGYGPGHRLGGPDLSHIDNTRLQILS